MNVTIQTSTTLAPVNLLEHAHFLKNHAAYVTASHHATEDGERETRIAVRAHDGTIIAVEVWPQAAGCVDHRLEDLFVELSMALILPRSHFFHMLRPFAHMRGAASREYPAVAATKALRNVGTLAEL